MQVSASSSSIFIDSSHLARVEIERERESKGVERERVEIESRERKRAKGGRKEGRKKRRNKRTEEAADRQGNGLVVRSPCVDVLQLERWNDARMAIWRTGNLT